MGCSDPSTPLPQSTPSLFSSRFSVAKGDFDRPLVIQRAACRMLTVMMAPKWIVGPSGPIASPEPTAFRMR